MQAVPLLVDGHCAPASWVASTRALDYGHFRRILSCLAVVGSCLASPAVAQSDADFVSLCDGQTLSGWQGFKQLTVPPTWTLDDGAIRGSGDGPDLITQRQYADFDLRFEWKIQPGGNSGVVYRVQEDRTEQSYQSGIEYQLLDDEHFRAEVVPTNGSGAIYGLYGNDDKVLRPVGQYNSSRIVARGQRLEHWLNDELVAECVIGSPDWNKRVAASKFHAWPTFAGAARGHIALQAHGSMVWFRNLRIRELQQDVESKPTP